MAQAKAYQLNNRLLREDKKLTARCDNCGVQDGGGVKTGGKSYFNADFY